MVKIGGIAWFNAMELALASNRDAVRAGIAFVSEDRLSLGAVEPHLFRRGAGLARDLQSGERRLRQSYLLVPILAAVLGGVDPFGGFDSVAGSMLELAILQVISSGLNESGVSPYPTTAIWGLVVIGVMTAKSLAPNLPIRRR